MKKHFIISGLAIGALLSVGSSAHAQMINYPGSNCVGLSGTPTINTLGEAENRTTSTITVLCPMVRYDADRANSTPNFRGQVFVTDSNPSADVSCVSHATNGGGNPRLTSARQSSSGYNNAAQILSFDGPNDPYGWTYRYYVCTIPPNYSGLQSAIRMYRGETYAP